MQVFNDLPCNLDWDTKRNGYSAVIAGILFFSGWWLMIDTAVSNKMDLWSNWFFLLTVASTFTFFMINSVPNSVIQGSSFDEGLCGQRGARLWLMLGFIGSFGCLVAGIWIMFSNYVMVQGEHRNWPGIAVFIHTLLIFAASLIYKFGRTEELWE